MMSAEEIDHGKSGIAMAEPRGDPAEARIDCALDESFPASDAPFWTLGVQSAGYVLDGLDLERDRIALLIRRDGLPAAMEWVRRTLRIYRRAVLDKTGFARIPPYRRGYIRSYCDFKRWLERIGAHHHAGL